MPRRKQKTALSPVRLTPSPPPISRRTSSAPNSPSPSPAVRASRQLRSRSTSATPARARRSPSAEVRGRLSTVFDSDSETGTASSGQSQEKDVRRSGRLRNKDKNRGSGRGNGKGGGGKDRSSKGSKGKGKTEEGSDEMQRVIERYLKVPEHLQMSNNGEEEEGLAELFGKLSMGGEKEKAQEKLTAGPRFRTPDQVEDTLARVDKTKVPLGEWESLVAEEEAAEEGGTKDQVASGWPKMVGGRRRRVI